MGLVKNVDQFHISYRTENQCEGVVLKSIFRKGNIEIIPLKETGYDLILRVSDREGSKEIVTTAQTIRQGLDMYERPTYDHHHVAFCRYYDGGLMQYHHHILDERSLASIVDIPSEAEAFNFQHKTFFIGGTFTPLTELQEELGQEEIDQFKFRRIFGKLTSRHGHIFWLRYNTYGNHDSHIGLDEQNRLVLPSERQEREIISIAHSHVLYSQMTFKEAQELMAGCEHMFDPEDNVGGGTNWECRRCGLGYEIPYETDDRFEDNYHEAYRDAWPKDVAEVFRKYPGLIMSGFMDVPLGFRNPMYATPVVPGYQK